MRAAIAVFVAAGIIGQGLWAQSPVFEVATIKVNNSGSGGANFPGLRKGIMNATNVSMRMMLQVAYGLSSLRINGPEWLDADRFDVVAKSPDGVPDTEIKPMLQALLKDRFQVTIHREMKEMPVYEMVVAKTGLKISPYEAGKPLPAPAPRRAGSMMMGATTMQQLADNLTSSADRPVIDKTGLDGRYAYVLSYMPLSAKASDAADGAPPDFFTAIQEQLGLKLEPKKEPIEIIVVDHAERVPSEN